jgi:predicted Zn-dependent peptidase
VYQESTEIAILAPAYLSSSLLDKLTALALQPHLNQAAFEAARTRLAAQQVAAGELVDQALRDALFAHMFNSGPLHDSTYGDPLTLRALSLNDVTAFVSRAYVPASELVVAVGSLNHDEVVKRVAAAAPPASASQTMPSSEPAAASNAPISLAQRSAEGGLAMGWAGPPIADERAATAMDFLSDYLAHPGDGVLAKIIHGLNPATSFNGQFITLRNPGVFFVTASGEGLNPSDISPAIGNAIRETLRKPLPPRDFDRALGAFVTHLLSDMQTAQALADNYGWYFAQGALPYSPSATDTALSGQYFQRVASLTPDFVSQVARRYLLASPVIIVLPARAVPSGLSTPL